MEPSKQTALILIGKTENIVHELSGALNKIDEQQYAMPLPLLSGASIGAHTRHIIEFFECLVDGYERLSVDYGSRPRNKTLETEKSSALHALINLCDKLPFEERLLFVKETPVNGFLPNVQSGYLRELLYAIEHAIHHMAIIKIGLRSFGIAAEKDFGVAPSTIQHRNACAS